MVTQNSALKNTTYEEDMLPAMDQNVPRLIQCLVQNILQRNPSKVNNIVASKYAEHGKLMWSIYFAALKPGHCSQRGAIVLVVTIIVVTR